MTDAAAIPDLGLLQADEHRSENGVEFFDGLLRRHGDRVRYRTSFGRFVVVNHPADVHELARKDNFRRLSFLQIALGNGLLTSEGAWWRRQRQLVTPVFTPEGIAQFGPLVTAQTLAIVPQWNVHADSGGALDVTDEMSRLTLSIILRSLFGYEIDGTAAGELLRALRELMADLSALASMAFGAPQVVTPSRQQAFRERMGVVEKVGLDIIARRRGASSMPDDLLTRLLTSRIEGTGELLSERQLRDEVVTLMVAGHETTALALDWTWYLIARHPRAEARLHEELDAVLEGRAPVVADLPRLAWTGMVVKEAMRLYPPVWNFNRRALREDRLGDVAVAAGEIVTVCTYSVHRHPEFWPEPEAFRPERFTDANPDRRQLRAYIPFGAGRHLCAGMHFSLMEATLVVATLAQRFRVRPVSDPHPAMEPGFTLKMRGGLPVRIERRVPDHE